MMKKVFPLFFACASVALSSCATDQSTSANGTPANATAADHGSYSRLDRPVRMINGKPYVYVEGELGSNIPGRWVPADSPAAQAPPNTQAISSKTLQDLQGGYR